MAIQYLSSLPKDLKTVLVRASLDEPLKEDGTLGDDFRLQSAVPTIQALRSRGLKVVVCGKLGRPEGKVVPELSLLPVAKRLAELLDLHFQETDFALPTDGVEHLIFLKGDIREEHVREQVKKIKGTDVLVLENMEFYPGELELNLTFAKQLASIADAFVSDDFAKCHHPVASIDPITKFLPSFAGLQLEKEIKGLGKILAKPAAPFILMMGGIKITDKAKTLKNLGKKADKILLSGGLANLFFKIKSFEVGKSKIEHEAESVAWEIEKNYKSKLLLPLDVVVTDDINNRTRVRCCAPHEVKKNEYIFDIGPKTILAFAGVLKQAKTIVWNGPLGHFEVRPFHHGTLSLARIVGAVGQGRAYTVVGGGETVDAVREAGQEDMVDLLSTGGGAMLEFLAGSELPGITALK